MTGALPPWPLLLAFMAASFVLAITPGPGVMYIVTRSALHGRRPGIASVLGVAVGNLANAVAAALGLAALLAVSALAFTVMKVAGAAYLLWLGLRLLLSAASPPQAGEAPAAAPLLRVFGDGVVVAALNPKTTLFFAALLPQFVSAPEHGFTQTLALGALFVLIAACTDCLYALAATRLSPVLTRQRLAAGRRVGGGILIGLGILTALSGQRAAR